ncbi:uncharacterized protein LOC106159414 [Lingula anatina]|uniref:Uncharacterized protein LOC106159414 n=1 Tax=Lingula anatina TaxID=7574 RepID=A0A1S3HYP8_LINAN|nr:uncharacterized protein LOC106159414 [Lingula anatina]|eukprot:XP_013391147.1 uncharacterized protein LOC106159414 [Lingula anatina]
MDPQWRSAQLHCPSSENMRITSDRNHPFDLSSSKTSNAKQKKTSTNISQLSAKAKNTAEASMYANDRSSVWEGDDTSSVLESWCISSMGQNSRSINSMYYQTNATDSTSESYSESDEGPTKHSVSQGETSKIRFTGFETTSDPFFHRVSPMHKDEDIKESEATNLLYSQRLSKRRKNQAKATILYSVIFFCIYASFTFLSTRLEKLAQSIGVAGDISTSIYIAATTLPAIFGGVLSDGVFGNYNLILACNFMLTLGNLIFDVIAFIPNDTINVATQGVFFNMAVGISAMSVGLQRSVVINFGVAQGGDRERKRRANIYWLLMIYALAQALVMATYTLEYRYDVSDLDTVPLLHGLKMGVPVFLSACAVTLLLCGRHLFIDTAKSDGSLSMVIRNLFARKHTIERSDDLICYGTKRMDTPETEKIIHGELKWFFNIFLRMLVFLATFVLFPLVTRQASYRKLFGTAIVLNPSRQVACDSAL